MTRSTILSKNSSRNLSSICKFETNRPITTQLSLPFHQSSRHEFMKRSFQAQFSCWSASNHHSITKSLKFIPLLSFFNVQQRFYAKNKKSLWKFEESAKKKLFDIATILTVGGIILYQMGWIYWTNYFLEILYKIKKKL